MITETDVRYHVQRACDASEGEYDVDGITRTLVLRYSLTGPAPRMTVDSIPHDDFWDIVMEYAFIER